MTPITLLFTALTLLPLVQEKRDVEADRVVLLDGKELTGQIVYDGSDMIVLRRKSREQEVELEAVAEVDSRVRHLRALLDRMTAVGAPNGADAASLQELATLARDTRLVGFAHMLHLATLLADPDNPGANEALGTRKKARGLSYKHGRKWILNAELNEAVESWKDRWTLQTTHYELQSNLHLELAMAVAVDLERFYLAFFDLFQEELGLREPEEIMLVRVFADDGAFPEPGDGRAGQFLANDRSVNVNAAHGLPRDILFHELTLQLLYMTSKWTAEAKGLVPPWVQVGLAEAFGTGVTGPPGASEFDIASIEPKHFRAQVETDKPYEFDRVVVFNTNDYKASSRQQEKYAQSYTLLHYMLFGEEGDLHDGFMDFMRSAYEGRSSITHLQDILPIDDKKTFEAAWFAYVDAVFATL